MRRIVAVALLAAAAAAGRAAGQEGGPADASAAGCLEFRGEMQRALAASPDTLQINALLFAAARKGCASALPTLFEAGASPLARDRNGQGALAIAAKAGHIGVVEALLTGDPQTVAAERDRPDVEGSTPLLLAAVAYRSAVAMRLVDAGADVNVANRVGETALSAAAYNDDESLFEALIAKGAKLEPVDRSGKSAMLYAAARGAEPIVAKLLDLGVDPNKRYGADLTALMWAAGYANNAQHSRALATVRLLISRGAKLDLVDDRGLSALMIAASLGHDEVALALIAAGADRGLRDKSGKTAAALAVSADLKAALQAP